MSIARRMTIDGDRIVDSAFAETADLRFVADHATSIRNSGYRRDKHGHGLLMEVPAILVEQYCNERGVTFREFVANPVHAHNMLRDPALAHFRTSGERVAAGDADRVYVL